MPDPKDQDLDAYLRDCVRIEPLALQEEYVRMPADIAFWNERFASRMRAHLLAKLARDETAGRLYIAHRERLLAAGTKSTEAQVASAVDCDPEMHAANLAVVDSESDLAEARGLCDALRTKREMLISLGASIRQELEGDPVVRRTIAEANARARGGG